MAKCVSTITSHKDRVWCVAWNPQGSLLASASSDRSIRLHGKEGDSWVCKTSLPEAHSRTVRFLAWAPSGNKFASSSFDSTVNIWDNSEGEFETEATVEGHENEVKCVAWASNGSLLATCSRDKSVWVWENDENDDFNCLSVVPAHTQDVKRVIFSHDSSFLVSASYDNTLKVFAPDVDDEWNVCATLSGHSSTVWCVTASPDDQYIVSGSADNSLRVWKRTPSPLKSPEEDAWMCVCVEKGVHPRPVYDCHWSPSGNFIATGCGDDAVRIFRVDVAASDVSLSLLATIDAAHTEDVNSVAWNPCRPDLLASASDDGSVKIWDVGAIIGA